MVQVVARHTVAAGSVGIIGAGIVGLAVARQLAASGVAVTVFEKEAQVARRKVRVPVPSRSPGCRGGTGSWLVS